MPPSLRCSLRPLRRGLAGLACIACAASAARGAVWLSSTSFAANALPTIHADAAELATAQAQAGPGGYYKLRAKFIVPYSPGYHHGIDAVTNNGQRLTGSPGPGNYTVDLYWAAYDVNGTLRNTGPFYSHPVTIQAPNGGNFGLQADYFNGNNFQSLVRTAASGERPDSNWNLGGPAGTGVDNFSVRWTGWIEPLYSETYTFTTGSDDGMRVYIANLSAPVAGAYWDHGYLEASGSIQLTANTRYQIRVEFFENAGGATAYLFWQSPSQPRELIPLARLAPPSGGNPPASPPTIMASPLSQTVNVGATATFSVTVGGSPAPALQWRRNQSAIAGATGTSLTLSPVQPGDAGAYDVVATNAAGSIVSASATLTVNPVAGEGTGNGLRGDYFNGVNFNSPILTRIDARVDFPWQNGPPAPGIGSDNFSVRWSGLIEAPVSGYYTFTTRADDGVRLRLNQVTIIDDWTQHPPTDRSSAPVYLTAGTRTPIALDYFEAGGGAEVSLHWQPPGQGRTVVPTNRLYADSDGGATAWQTLLATSGTLYFSEDTDSEGNGTGNWSTSVDRHDITIPGPGMLRIYTTGSADTRGALLRTNGTPLEANLDGNGDGGNFFVERSIQPGAYIIEVSGAFQWNDTEAYTLYVEFRAEASAPRITSVLQAATPIGALFSYQITAESSLPVTFGASDLPPGLTVTAAGLIRGRTSQQGPFSIRLTASNGAGSDEETLTLHTFYDPPTASIAASAASIRIGETVQIDAFAASPTGTLNFLNIDQLSPYSGYYGQGDTGTELPPSLAHHPATNAHSYPRRLSLTLNQVGTYRFRAVASDGAIWYPSANEVTVVVAASTLHALTVHQGTGSGTYAPGTVVAVSAHTAPQGQVFSHWTLESGTGSFASATSTSTTFTLGTGAAVIRAHYATLQPPVITASPSSQTLAVGQTASLNVTATGSPPLSYQWHKTGAPLANGGNVSGATTATLTLAPLTGADAGVYTVVVSNAAGAATSSPATLAVVAAPSLQLILHRP